MSKRKKYVADFETTTTPEDVRVWAFCLVDIETSETVLIGNDIADLLEFLRNKNTVVYYHNLRFDAEFWLSYLLLNGFKYAKTKQAGTFETSITEEGIFYSLTIYFKQMKKRYHKVVFYDSLKKLPFKVSQIAKAFELEDQKGKIDYKAYRPKGHQLTEAEKDYIVKDCRIVAQALNTQFEKGLTKMTNASDAMNGYKKIIGLNRFDEWFPVFPIELDTDIRRAYKGGFTYLNPKYKDKRVKGGLVFDVNSLYPYCMHDCLLPYSYPMFFEGKYKPDPVYPLYIVHMRCTFKLKDGHIPCLQLKNNRRYVETEYLTTSVDAQGIDEPVELYLTNVDYQLLIDHYVLDEEEYINGWKFRGAVGMFNDYIDYWMHIKETTTGGQRQLAKLQLNSLYGRFALNPRCYEKVPYLDENGVVRYEVINTDKKALKYGAKKPELREPVYTAMGCFITAYAREKTIRSAQRLYDRFIYADTDSLHICGTEIPEGLEIHSTRLGAWKNEGTFTDSLYIRAKTYLETINGKLHVTCAGMPDNVKEQVTYENFHSGSTFEGKLVPKRYKGGVILQETTFTIK